MSRKQDRIQYWQQTLAHFLSSGLSQAAYTRQYKISKASLYKWSKYLAIPLKPHKSASSEGHDQPLSFIELPSSLCEEQPPQVPLKLELLGVGGSIIKAEMCLGWEQMVGLLKALAH